HSKELKHDCVTRLDRDRPAGVNHACNSRHRCRDRRPAVAMAYLQSITFITSKSRADDRQSSCSAIRERGRIAAKIAKLLLVEIKAQFNAPLSDRLSPYI